MIGSWFIKAKNSYHVKVGEKSDVPVLRLLRDDDQRVDEQHGVTQSSDHFERTPGEPIIEQACMSNIKGRRSPVLVQ